VPQVGLMWLLLPESRLGLRVTGLKGSHSLPPVHRCLFLLLVRIVSPHSLGLRAEVGSGQGPLKPSMG
jgi:hypothetical protein